MSLTGLYGWDEPFLSQTIPESYFEVSTLSTKLLAASAPWTIANLLFLDGRSFSLANSQTSTSNLILCKIYIMYRTNYSPELANQHSMFRQEYFRQTEEERPPPVHHCNLIQTHILRERQTILCKIHKGIMS